MRPRCNLRHDTTKRRVLLQLRSNPIGQNEPLTITRQLDNRRRRFVAGCLKAENAEGVLWQKDTGYGSSTPPF